MYFRKIFLVVLLIVFGIQGIGFSYYGNNFYSDDDMNNSYYTSYNTNSSYNKLDLFGTTPRSDFLNSSINESFIMTLQKNGTEADFYDNKLAKNLDVSDYTGFSIGNGKEFSSYSNLTNGYDKQTFSGVKFKDDKLYSCTVTTDRGGFVKEAISDIKYNAQDLVTSLAVKTFGQNGGTAMLQTISGITAGLSSDRNRYRNELDYSTMKMNEPGTRGFGINVAALEGRLAPPNNVAKEFTIKALGNIINYKDVSWARDLITGFKANMIDNKGNISDWNVSTILDQKGKIGAMAVDVISKNIIKHKEWSKNGELTLDKFVKNIKLGVNPLKILGSSSIQIGDIKVAYLANSFTDIQKVEVTYDSDLNTVIDKVGTAIKKAGEYIGKAVSWIKGLFGIEGSSETSDEVVVGEQIISSQDSTTCHPQSKALGIHDKDQNVVSSGFPESLQDSENDRGGHLISSSAQSIVDSESSPLSSLDRRYGDPGQGMSYVNPRKLEISENDRATKIDKNVMDSKQSMPGREDFNRGIMKIDFMKNKEDIRSSLFNGLTLFNRTKNAPIGTNIIVSDIEVTSQGIGAATLKTNIQHGTNYLAPKEHNLIGNEHSALGLGVSANVTVNVQKQEISASYELTGGYKGEYKGIKINLKGFTEIEGGINKVVSANIFNPIGVTGKIGGHSSTTDARGNENHYYTYLETSKQGLATVYKHEQISPAGQMMILENRFIPGMREREKSKERVQNHSMSLLHDVMRGAKKSWKPGEVRQVVNYVVQSYKDKRVNMHIDRNTKEHLKAYIGLLPSLNNINNKNIINIKNQLDHINRQKSIMDYHKFKPGFMQFGSNNNKRNNDHYAYLSLNHREDRWN